MKKVLFFSFVSILISCSNQQKTNLYSDCYATYDSAYKAVEKAISEKDTIALKSFTISWAWNEVDSIINSYQNLTIEIIPPKKDGSYGVHEYKNTSATIFVNFKENGVVKDIKSIEFSKVADCYKIVKVLDIKSWIEPNPQWVGEITTITDGYDVKRVNLWSSTTKDRIEVGFCSNNEKVKILAYSGEYAKIKKDNGIEGWCLIGFLK